MDGDEIQDTDKKSVNFTSPDGILEFDAITSAFDKLENSKRPHAFMIVNRGPKYDQVELCGSMDNWSIRHPLQYDQYTN